MPQGMRSTMRNAWESGSQEMCGKRCHKDLLIPPLAQLLFLTEGELCKVLSRVQMCVT